MEIKSSKPLGYQTNLANPPFRNPIQDYEVRHIVAGLLGPKTRPGPQQNQTYIYDYMSQNLHVMSERTLSDKRLARRS